MASPFPSASQPITPTPSCVAPELLHPLSFQESLPSPQLGLYNTMDALGLNLPPNAFKAIMQGQASGRLSVLQNHYAGQPDGAENLKSVVDGKPTTVQSHSNSNPTMLKSLPGATLRQSTQVKARRGARAGKSKAKRSAPAVARGPEHTTAPPATPTGPSGGETAAVQPFQWATATAEEISRLPGLDNLPVDLINLILPRVRAFAKEFESSARSNSRPVVHEQNLPAERPELAPVARSLGLPLPTAQPEPSLVMQLEQPEPALLVAGQLCGPDEDVPMFEELDALQQRDENVRPEPNFEEPPSSVLEGLLDLEHSWSVEASQTRSSCTPPVQEVIQSSVCALSGDPNGPSELGDGTAWGGAGTGVAAQFDFGTFDGWEEFARF